MNIKQVIVYQIIILFLQVIFYFGCENFQKNPYLIDLPIDKKIPVIPIFTLIYILWFPLIAIFPISLYLSSPSMYVAYIIAWIIDVVVSIIIYMVYPTTFERPKNIEDYKFGWMLKIIYKWSYKGVNCMPSLHCSLSTLVLIGAILCVQMSLILRIIYSLIAIGIIVSTLFTKQHVILDVITGVLLGLVCFILGYYFIYM